MESIVVNVGTELRATDNLAELTLAQIARIVRKDWKKINYAAVPYLSALGELQSTDDKYGYDDGANIVRYFLCNAGSWRGPVAKAVKAELKSRVGIK